MYPRQQIMERTSGTHPPFVHLTQPYIKTIRFLVTTEIKNVFGEEYLLVSVFKKDVEGTTRIGFVIFQSKFDVSSYRNVGNRFG